MGGGGGGVGGVIGYFSVNFQIQTNRANLKIISTKHNYKSSNEVISKCYYIIIYQKHATLLIWLTGLKN